MNKKKWTQYTWVGRWIVRVQSFIIDHFTLLLSSWSIFFFMCAPICRVTCVWKKCIVIFHTITLEIMHSHPRHHIYAIISSVVITDWPCVPTYQMYFVWSARRCLDSHWLRAAQSHFGTAPAPGHVRQVNNLVFWIDDATATRGQPGGRMRFGYGQCGGESGTEFE